jgi:hypothetical protein
VDDNKAFFLPGFPGLPKANKIEANSLVTGNRYYCQRQGYVGLTEIFSKKLFPEKNNEYNF